MNTNSERLITQLAEQLTTAKLMLAVAESCTGGWLAKSCTDIAGSSAWFDRGFVTYSNQSKQDMLAVNSATLENYGAVSQQTALEMATGALAHSQADIVVAITGIAGPDGGTPEKPVGTVWFAWAGKHFPTYSEQHLLAGNRELIREQAVDIAIEGIIKNARA